MVSQRRNSTDVLEPPRAANAIPEEAILDAAYDLLLAVGMRRITMADIARQADVSRATLYRRWPNVQAVIAALMTREFAQLAARHGRLARCGRPRSPGRRRRACRRRGARTPAAAQDRRRRPGVPAALPGAAARRDRRRQLALLEGAIRPRNRPMARSGPAIRRCWRGPCCSRRGRSCSPARCWWTSVNTAHSTHELAELLDRYLAPGAGA